MGIDIQNENEHRIILADSMSRKTRDILFIMAIGVVFLIIDILFPGSGLNQIGVFLLIFVGGIKVIELLYFLFRQNSIIVDKNHHNIVLNKTCFNSIEQIQFSNIKEIELEKERLIYSDSYDDIWKINIITAEKRENIFISRSCDKATEIAVKISKFINKELIYNIPKTYIWIG